MPRHFERSSPIPADAQALYDWHARRAAFFRLVPPWESVEVADIQGEFGDGQRVILRAGVVGPVKKDWVAELFDVVPGRQFRDRELSGPFAEWTHSHRFDRAPAGSTLTDSIQYRLPFGPLGGLGAGIARGKLDAMFRYRHAVTASDLGRHAKFPGKSLHIAMTGSTGLIGTDLCHFLAAGGHTVKRLTRNPDPKPRLDGTTSVTWNPSEPLDPSVLEGVDAVIHLAGDPIAEGRWDAAKKARIRESRVAPTHHVAVACGQVGVKTLLSGSAVGYYGSRGDESLTEDAKPGDDFLAGVCREWEAATAPAESAGVRVVHLRTGVVLSPRGGALAEQLPAFKSGAGAVVGSGEQFVPWVTIGDEVGMIHHCLMTDSVRGPVNLVSPNPVTNREFGRVLAGVLNRPYLLTVPAPALRLLFGELADAALLASCRAVPAKLQASGFVWDHAELKAGLGFVLGRGG